MDILLHFKYIILPQDVYGAELKKKRKRKTRTVKSAPLVYCKASVHTMDNMFNDKKNMLSIDTDKNICGPTHFPASQPWKQNKGGLWNQNEDSGILMFSFPFFFIGNMVVGGIKGTVFPYLFCLDLFFLTSLS